MTNFPIFTWLDKKTMEYDYERFQKIEQRIMEILGLEGDDAFRAQIRKGLATVLRKIRALAQTPESRVSFTSVRN
jgi:hypothetical protein